ncbi:ARF GTPase-activating protein [Hibiscus syriacus]|uniref:ARF GTPase-activating protein n=1 Tax=Hibiscus syriacus TaxID=106335 RepID=A0A6A2Z3E3_HIBSY|nr:uncharacterized protein DDB_G0283697-like [Hibiscus syriacus]XP_039019892.1 uncharacterized protein DDB_G0283697-like [Hibiscus syriacus]KAE8686494.1 ARF GTPase-activating protein [Hibiscus syriacus]
MDDSFKLRVQKVFGSLQSSHSSPQQQQRPPLWSLSDDEVERREWRRESAVDREDTLCSSSFDEFLKKERKYRSGRRKEPEDVLDNDDDDGDDDARGSSQPRSRKIENHGDELEIRSCIGMDSTLDNEEEEDEYDKVASGRENAGERLYMSDVADHGSFLNSHNILQRTFNYTSSKDHRANHMAARVRLKEDDEEAQKVNDCGMSNSEIRELSVVKSSNNGCQLRSILKRKNTGTDSTPQKHERFDCAFKNDFEEQFEKSEDCHSEDSEDVSIQAENDRALPDYLRNPSRYTCYSFDSSSEVGEDSNAQSSEDVLKLLPNSKSTESFSKHEEAPRYLPKSVTFIPKRKPGNRQLGSGISAFKGRKMNVSSISDVEDSDVEDSEDDATEDATPETSAANDTPVIQKGGRSYRVKSQPDDFDLEG